MNEYINEIEINNYPKPVNIEGTSKILVQMKNCICKIYTNNAKGTGFFCKINNNYSVLITNNHVINNNYISNNKILNITIEDDKIERNIRIDDNRKVYLNEKLDITIIEIKNIDKINYFLELDENILSNISKISILVDQLMSYITQKEKKHLFLME